MLWHSPARREADHALHEAKTYAAWQQAAEAIDQLSGAAAWRTEDESPYYDAALIRAELAILQRLRADGAAMQLAEALTASLYRQHADLAAPELYTVARAGTKHLITNYLSEVESALLWLAATPIPGLPAPEKRRRFAEAAHAFGRTALMLSGGATWGFHHLGVVKALFQNGVLPRILSGASTGAMIAAGVCSRNDVELADLFDRPEQMRLDGLLSVGLSRAIRDRAWLDPDRLLAVLRHNVGDLTFAEAFARSGRALNISVSPTRTRQKPRVLTHLTAPDVLVARAALASSALPGLYPPIVLEARNAAGETVPYVPSERWVDGSLYEDLPKLRLARLHNVNHFIVSQTNPHVVPFLGKPAHHGPAFGLARHVADAAGSAAKTQGMVAADLARRAAFRGPLQQLADRAYALASQDYGGDIDIYPAFHAELLTKIVANPTPHDLAAFIRAGETATWPKLGMITDQTRIGRAFETGLALLESA